MANTYTTDWQSVDNGDTTTINPQDLIVQSGYISAENAEIQWRGESDFFQRTRSGSSTNSDSDTTTVSYEPTQSVNSDTAITTTDTDIKKVKEQKQKSSRDSTSGRTASVGDTVDTGKPSLPTNKDITVDSVTISYSIKEIGGRQDNLTVSFDDDPYDDANYDTTKQVTIAGDETKTIFEKTHSQNLDYNDMDGAQMVLKSYEGDSSSGSVTSVKLIANFTVDYTITSKEDPDPITETAKVEVPDVRGGAESHRFVVEYSNKENDVFSNLPPRYVGARISTESPSEDGESVTLKAYTFGEVRNRDPATVSVDYPDIPSGYSVDRYEIRRSGYGNDFDVIYDDRSGQTRTKTPSGISEGEQIELEIKAEYSKTITLSDDTVNPTVEGDYIEEGFNTDNVLFVLDKSNSVEGSERNNVALSILNSLPDSSTAALLSFNFDPELNVPADTLSNNRSLIEQEINNLPTEGGTDVEEAVDFARENIGDESDAGTIVFITDGNNIVDAEELTTSPDNINFDFIGVGVGDNIDEEFMTNLASLLGGQYIEGPISDTTLSTRLNNDQLSSWQELSGFTSGEQTLTHSIQESGEAEFRIRFDWVFETPEPIYGRTGFYDDSAGLWRECVVTDVNSNSLEYNHVSVYNDTEEDWGALDVVDVSNDAAIEAFAFYDEDAGWLAPREYETV